jgi:hypothetical protein
MAEAKIETKPVEARKPIYKLKPTRLHPGEARILWWYAEIEEGTPYEALFDPVYWDNHGYKLKTGNRILAAPDEGHYEAEFLVVGNGVGGVRIVEVRKLDLSKIQPAPLIADQYRIKYAGPHHRWRVERVADNGIEQSGFGSESDASIWLAENLRALAKAKAA